MSPSPPCIVLGLETQIGLHLIRELGKAGVRVIGIAQEHNAIGLASRYLWKGVVCDRPRSEALRALIVELGERHGACPLIAISEANLAWLSAHDGQFGLVRPVLPSPEALAIVQDKSKTLALASELGIEVPQSYQPEAGWTTAQILGAVQLPCILKWSDPNAVAATLKTQGLALLKVEHVDSEPALAAALHRYDALGQWPLVQSFCPGVGLGQFFFLREGRAVRRFQHLRIAEWPPEGGFSSVCDALPLAQHAALQERSIALLRRIGWSGVAMVEYRYDAATGRAVLMEVNGRFWGSYPLASQAGAGFAVLTYNGAVGLPTFGLREPEASMRCRMLATEIKRLIRILFQPQRIASRQFAAKPRSELFRFFSDFLRPGVRYYVWSWSDPKPFLADIVNFALGVFRQRWRRWR